MAGAERVFALLDTEPAWQDAPDAVPLPAIRGRVEFRDVSLVVEAGQTDSGRSSAFCARCSRSRG
jgi:ATP-binding cassette subfamily B protein